MREDYPLVGSYNNQRITPIDAERSVNCFEFIDPNGKKPRSLISTSGLTNQNYDFFDETGGFRNSFVVGTNQYHVIGGSTILIRQDTSFSRLFQWANTGSDVSSDANSTQIMWVDGEEGWIYDLDVNFAVRITDAGFPTAPVDMTVLDGFFVVIQGNSNQFQISELNNGLIWSDRSGTWTVNSTTNIITSTIGASLTGVTDYANLTPVTLDVSGGGVLPTVSGTALDNATTYFVARVSSTTFYLARTKQDAVDVANGDTSKAINFTGTGTPTLTIANNGQLQQGTVNSDAGNLVACETLHRNLFFFSENFTEVWNNQGIGANLPFRRVNSLLMQYGCASRNSVARGFDRMFFLARQEDGLGQVMEIKGTQPIPVSNFALDYQLAQYDKNGQIKSGVSGASDPVGFLVKENGLIFYRLNFTAANHTYVLNVSMSTPQDLRWHEEEMLDGNRHVAQTHAYANGKNYVGHYNAPTLYILDDQNPTNDGQIIRRMRIGKPVMPPTGQRIQVNRLWVDFLQGQPFEGAPEDVEILTEGADDILAEDGNPLITETQTVTELASHPIAYLSISLDGGQSYGYSKSALMGRTGQRTYYSVWRKLGRTKRGQAFVPKIEFFERLNFAILGAGWDFEILPE